MNKRAQAVTVTIIIGMMVVVAFSALFFLENAGTRETSGKATEIVFESSLKIPAIRSYTESCLKYTGEQGLRQLSNEDERVYVEDFTYYHETSENEIINYLKRYISANINDCLGFSVFEKDGFTITKDIISSDEVEIKIIDSRILVNSDYELKVEKGESESFINNINTELNARIIKK